jgi:hypothetical protein
MNQTTDADSRTEQEIKQLEELWGKMSWISKIILLVSGEEKVHPKRTRFLLGAFVLILAAVIGLVVYSVNSVTAFVIGFLVCMLVYTIWYRLRK